MELKLARILCVLFFLLTGVSFAVDISCLEGDSDCNGPYSVNENAKTGFEIHGFAISDMEVSNLSKLTVKLSDYGATGADSLFDASVSSTKDTAYIVVKNGAKLDYEKIQPTHVVVLTVSDGEFVDTLIRAIIVLDMDDASVEPVVAIDCINYEGTPDVRCMYHRINQVRQARLFIVPTGEDLTYKNAIPGASFYVYAPKAPSDSVKLLLKDSESPVFHKQKVTSNDSGYVRLTVNAPYPIHNVALGTSEGETMEDPIVSLVYNFYAPEIEFCLDKECKNPVTDTTSLKKDLNDSLIVYARAYIPIGPEKGKIDSTLTNTFYIKDVNENLRFYSLDGVEISDSKIDFTNGQATFVIMAKKAVSEGQTFSLNSFVDPLDETKYIVSQKFLGSIQFVDSAKSELDTVSTTEPDASEFQIPADSDSLENEINDTQDDYRMPIVRIEYPISGTVTQSSFVDVNWTVNGVYQDTLNRQALEPGENWIVREYCDKAGKCSRDSVSVICRGDECGEGIFAEPSFRIVVTGSFEFRIISEEEYLWDDSYRMYAVMDLQGRVLRKGDILSAETTISGVPAGAYIVKVGLGTRRVNIR